MGYIYKITNLINNKSYIGLTKRNPKQRFWEHLKPSRKKVSALSNAISKYGKDRFIFEIIEKTEDIQQKEEYYIKKYNTLAPNGYNLTTGGENPKFTEKELKRRSDFMKNKPGYNKNKKQSKEWVEKRICNRRKIIIGININNNDIIELSGYTAVKNAGFCASYIYRICKNRLNITYKNYKWSYKDNI